MLLILWPHATGLEPPLHLAGFELIMVVRPHGKVLPRGRTIEAILRDPLGR